LERLAAQAEDIGRIMNVISRLRGPDQLLRLNAAIEAAGPETRAGALRWWADEVASWPRRP
jgi:hypothetical protein